MKSNKGFTMIEIIGAVIIMGILVALIIPGVSHLMRQFRSNYYEEIEASIVESAKDFFADNRIYKPAGELMAQLVYVDTLVKKNYIEDVKDYNGNACTGSYVIAIYMGNGEYEYHTCLKCIEDDYDSIENNKKYCDKSWLNNDVHYDFGDSNDYYFYYGTSREKIKEELLKALNVVKYYANGEVLERVEIGEKGEGILPNNIDEIETESNLGSEYEKEFPLVYEINGKTITDLSVVIYRHKAPSINIKKISDNSDYTSGAWSNGVIITLSPNDQYFALADTSVGSYQWYVDGKWENITCSMTTEDSCSVSIKENVDKTYKFRIVTNEGNISDESSEYIIRVDVDKPKVSITPNGSEPIVYVGSTNGTISFSLTTSDTGGSNIKSRKYAISPINTVAPTSFTNFNDNSYGVSESRTGNIYYVWSQVEDNAGNKSIEVWPSNAFTMKYEIKYNSNGGSGAPGTQYKSHGAELVLSSIKPTREGYTFNGWTTSSTSTDVSYEPMDTYTANDSTTLYAVWQQKNIQ